MPSMYPMKLSVLALALALALVLVATGPGVATVDAQSPCGNMDKFQECGRGDKLQCCDAATATCVCYRDAGGVSCSCQTVAAETVGGAKAQQQPGDDDGGDGGDGGGDGGDQGSGDKGDRRRIRRCRRQNQSSCGLRRPPLCCFNRSEACICQDRRGRNCACVPDREWDDWKAGRGNGGGGRH